MSNSKLSRSIRADIVISLAICALIFGLGFISLDNNCNWGDDFAAYMSDGFAMAQGRYHEQLELNVTLRSGRLVAEESEHVHAWGFPLVQALVYKLFGFETKEFSQLWLYKLPSLIAFSLMAGVYYLFLRRHSLGRWLCIFLSLWLCAHLEFFYAIRNLYNDVFFMALSLICFYLADTYLVQDQRKSQVLWGIALGIVLWFSYSVRLNGVVAVVSVLLAQLLWLLSKKKKPGPTDLVPASVFAFLFFIFNRLIFPVPTSTSSAGDMTVSQFIKGSAYYWEQLVTWAKHFVEICLDIPIKLIATFFYSVFDSEVLCALVSRVENFAYNELYTAFAVLILMAAFAGMLCCGLKSDLHIVFFIFVSFIGTAALNLGQELRYLYVLLPHMLMYAALFVKKTLSLIRINQKKNTDTQRFAAIVLSAVLSLFAVVPAVRSGVENLTRDTQENLTAYSAAAIEVYNYIQDNTAEDESIAFFKPRALYLNTGRVSLLPEKNGFSVDDADYYLHYIPMTASYIPDGREAEFRPIFENYEFILYQKIN